MPPERTVLHGRRGRLIIEHEGEGIKVSVESGLGWTRRAERGVRTMPMGAFETLEPLLKGIIPEDERSSDEDFSYWTVREQAEQQAAIRRVCAQLRNRQWRIVEVAEVMVRTNQKVLSNLALGNINEDQVEVYISQLAGVIRPYYSTRKPLGRK